MVTSRDTVSRSNELMQMWQEFVSNAFNWNQNRVLVFQHDFGKALEDIVSKSSAGRIDISEAELREAIEGCEVIEKDFVSYVCLSQLVMKLFHKGRV